MCSRHTLPASCVLRHVFDRISQVTQIRGAESITERFTRCVSGGIRIVFEFLQVGVNLRESVGQYLCLVETEGNEICLTLEESK